MYKKIFLKTFYIIGITLILVARFGVHFSCAESTGPPWQMFRHDLRHTGVSPFKGAQTNNLKWKICSREKDYVITCNRSR